MSRQTTKLKYTPSNCFIVWTKICSTLCKSVKVVMPFRNCCQKENKRPWQDSNLQSSDPKSDALSITPQGHNEIVWFWSQFIVVWQMRDNQQNDSNCFIAWTKGFITLCKCIDKPIWLCAAGRKNDPGKIWTCNLLIRSQPRYPLRHRALDASWWLWSQFICVLARCLVWTDE